MTLTARQVEAAKPKEKPYKLTDAGGLYLFVAPSGLKSWRANYMLTGKQKTRTYGRWPDLSLSAARQAHALAKNAVVVEQAAPKVATFAEVANKWFLLHIPTLTNSKHRIQVVNTLERFAFPALGAQPIDQIKRAQLVAVVQAAQVGGRVETAHRVAGRITAVFDYAQDAGIIETHPAAGLVRVLQPRKVRRPMASLPPDEVGRLLVDIEDYEEPITRLGLQFLSLTFVRVGELRGMRWDELREDGGIWVVPEERMKLRVPHVVPLSHQAQGVLEQLRLINGERELVFASPLMPNHPISENTLLFALYRLGYRGRMTAHGFRALASTVLNEQSDFGSDVIERQLAHKELDAVRASYNRAQYLPRRRELMTWWADWLDRQREDHRRASE